MAGSGFILLQRQILEWEWWSDINTFRVWTTILLLANFEDKKWHGIDVKRGQFLTSLSSLSKKSGLSIQQTRTAIEHLKSTGEITCQPTKRYTLITVEKYNNYQLENGKGNTQSNKQVNKQVTKKQHEANKQVTTTNTLNELNTLNTFNEMNGMRSKSFYGIQEDQAWTAEEKMAAIRERWK